MKVTPRYHAHSKHPPHKDRHTSLGIGLLYGPTVGGGLMSEVPLYTSSLSNESTPGHEPHLKDVIFKDEVSLFGESFTCYEPCVIAHSNDSNC
jgi:hypothetical protein